MVGFGWLFIASILFVVFCYYMHGGGDNRRSPVTTRPSFIRTALKTRMFQQLQRVSRSNR